MEILPPAAIAVKKETGSSGDVAEKGNYLNKRQAQIELSHNKSKGSFHRPGVA